jgi:hypothetical protein
MGSGLNVGNDYADRFISADADGITIHWYYFPFGTKRIGYSAIRSISRVNMGALTGRARVWGTASASHWASLDPLRAKKQTAFILDLGKTVRPFITPDDPEAFEAAVRANSQVPIGFGGRSVVI